MGGILKMENKIFIITIVCLLIAIGIILLINANNERVKFIEENELEMKKIVEAIEGTNKTEAEKMIEAINKASQSEAEKMVEAINEEAKK